MTKQERKEMKIIMEIEKAFTFGKVYLTKEGIDVVLQAKGIQVKKEQVK